MAMLIHHYLEHSAEQDPIKVAIVHDGNRISYGQLNRWSDNLAGHLQMHGVAKQDRVALLLENSIDYVLTYFAILKIGAVAAPLNPGVKPDGLSYMLKDLEPAAIVSNHKNERLLKATPIERPSLKVVVISNPRLNWQGAPFVVSELEAAISTGAGPSLAAVDIQPADLANIIYTSGSTGHPKGVMLSHGNIAANTNAICHYLALTSSDIQMVVLPFFYVMGQSLLNTHISAGGTLVINNRFMYPADVVQQMIEEKVTGFSGVPSTYAYLLNRSPLTARREQLVSLRYCSQAGGHMATSLKRALHQALPPHTKIFIMYGATEAAARLAYLEPEHFLDKMGSIGKPIPGVTIRLLDESGTEVPAGIEGELVAAGPNIMLGYWKDPDATAAVLDHNGYHTGDIGYRDKEGWLHVLRRKDGIVKVGGHRINPAEIEEYLMATETLIEAVVIGLPDPLLGSKIVAIVVPKHEDCDIRVLRQLCHDHLPAHKTPSEVIPTRTLPKSASGKIDREQCTAIAVKAITP